MDPGHRSWAPINSAVAGYASPSHLHESDRFLHQGSCRTPGDLVAWFPTVIYGPDAGYIVGSRDAASIALYFVRSDRPHARSAAMRLHVRACGRYRFISCLQVHCSSETRWCMEASQVSMGVVPVRPRTEPLAALPAAAGLEHGVCRRQIVRTIILYVYIHVYMPNGSMQACPLDRSVERSLFCVCMHSS